LLQAINEVVLLFLPGFRRTGFFQAKPFPVQQADSPADDFIGDQAGFG